MRDLSNPPKERIECAKACLPFVHAKKAEEIGGEQVQHITEVRNVIVTPPKYEERDREFLNETFERQGLPHRIDENGATVRSTQPAEPRAGPLSSPAERDPVADARSRLDRLRGVN
jgi:hypothetical protein